MFCISVQKINDENLIMLSMFVMDLAFSFKSQTQDFSFSLSYSLDPCHASNGFMYLQDTMGSVLWAMRNRLQLQRCIFL